MKKVHKVSRLDQVRLLADPLKLPLLQAFAEGPKTARQVAEELDQSVTRLYRHVDALCAAGLIEIVDERQKRGTVERTFRAVAARFEVDQSLFASDADNGAIAAVRDILRAGEREILDVVSDADAAKRDEALILRLRVRSSPERLAELRQLLEDWVETASSESPDDQQDGVEAGALIAFYPLRK